MNIKALLFLLSTLLVFSAEQDQPTKTYYPLNFGGYLGTNFNLHSPDFSTYPSPNNNSLVIPYNNSQTSMGYNIGAIVNYPIDSMFTFTGRIGYHSMSVDLESSGTYTENNSVISSDYQMQNSLGYLEITPGVQIFNLLPVKDLYLLGAVELGIPINANSKLDQSINSSTVTGQNIYDNDIASNVRFALAFGAGYVFRRDNWMITPELSFRFPLNDIANEDRFNSWSAPQVRLGVNITFGLFENKQETPDSYLSAKLEGPFTYRNNQKSKVDRLRIEEVKYSELFPLVPYVFFDKDQSTPSNEYQNLAVENAGRLT